MNPKNAPPYDAITWIGADAIRSQVNQAHDSLTATPEFA